MKLKNIVLAISLVATVAQTATAAKTQPGNQRGALATLATLLATTLCVEAVDSRALQICENLDTINRALVQIEEVEGFILPMHPLLEEARRLEYLLAELGCNSCPIFPAATRAALDAKMQSLVRMEKLAHKGRDAEVKNRRR